MTEQLPDSIAEAAAALRAGTTTAVELVERSIARAEAVDGASNPDRLGAYILRFDDQARAAAAVADQELAAGQDRGPLHGIPIAVKDLLTTSEGPTTAQSSAQDPEWGDRQDAAVVSRLRRAGAVITGKTSLSEFACGFPDPDKPFPVPRNPWDLNRWAGGSSGGSASAVAAGLVLGAIGTDTGGSVRIPAGFCGVTGLKTTWGAISTDGCLPLAWSFDSIGPIARSAEDCALVLAAIADDATAPATIDLRGLRIGVDRLDTMTAATDDGQPDAFAAALAVLRDAGAEIVELPLPDYVEVTAANYVIMLSEGYAYHLPALRSRWQEYGRSTRTLLSGGLAYTGADYVQAQRVRARSWQRARALFTEVDLHVSPMATVGAPTLHDLLEGDQSLVFGSLHTPYWATVGCPTAAVPIGLTSAGMPLSLQIAGPPGQDAGVLAAAAAYQRETGFHRLRPALG
ncbi:amidase [Nocardioides marmoriginsengisoli]|uniref:Amidase n=1 Tax=Nocardioides marmoriginsengisoli TaxID=661483 RepID=A0A3N0CFY7_9ACTN|nr:amidase [Nocardioides marmoriginsengisoli]RNL61926.1 amidase [Nocardioides marmoriginsengisoli]